MSYGTHREQRVGFNPDTNRYYIRNKYGAEIDVDKNQMDRLIEAAVVMRNKTRRLRRVA